MHHAPAGDVQRDAGHVLGLVQVDDGIGCVLITLETQGTDEVPTTGSWPETPSRRTVYFASQAFHISRSRARFAATQRGSNLSIVSRKKIE